MMLRSIMKPIIRSLVKQTVSTSSCNNRWGNYIINPKRVVREFPNNLSRHITSNIKQKKKKTEEFMKLEPEEANKSLYFCNVEEKGYKGASYAIRTVKLSDLLSSSTPAVPLQQVSSRNAHPHLPQSVGCGVFGTEIFIVGGIAYNCPTGSRWKRGVYKFDTRSNDPISKLKANLRGSKDSAVTIELCGKLYVLSSLMVDKSPKFEAFDPILCKWESLPRPPFYKIDYYAVANTKIFVFDKERPVFCFDAAHPGKKWRKVPTMGGDRYPLFRDKALVLDLPDEDDKKIVFAYSDDSIPSDHLQVYLMSLRDNQETMMQIGDFEIPEVQTCRGWGWCDQLIHIGGNKASLVCSIMKTDDEDAMDGFGGYLHDSRYGVVIPFQYEFDMTKGEDNGLTIRFMPFRFFQHHTDPSLYTIESSNCFVL